VTQCLLCGQCLSGNQYEVSGCTATTDVVCGTCDVSCASCDGSTTTDCTSCVNGSAIANGACVACVGQLNCTTSVATPEQCIGLYNPCSVCDPTFSNVNGFCYGCSAAGINPHRLATLNVYTGIQVPVGSYNVSSGPIAGPGTPDVYSCLDAAAFLFGGIAGDYVCSVNPTGAATQTAYVDTTGGAQTIEAEDFSFDSCPLGYGAAGEVSTDTSAYVQDHVQNNLNYIFTRTRCSPPCPTGFTEVSGCTDTADRVCM